MGTRGLHKVINSRGQVKVKQYSQWDNYPSGQGLHTLRCLRSADLVKYQKNLNKVHKITKAEGELVESDSNWATTYPHMSRDCGANIHNLIEDGNVKFLAHISDKEANYWCVGFWTIDFKNNTFTSKYHDNEAVFNLDALPTDEEYLRALGVDEDEIVSVTKY
jgi:hypothetical protein